MASGGSEASKIKLNQTTVEMLKGVFLQRYTVDQIDEDYAGSSITIDFTMTGTDSPSFQLSTAQLIIPVKPADPEPAPFADMLVQENNRGNIKLYVKSNKLAYIYCVTAYIHMPDPTYEEVRNGTLGLKYSYSKPIYTEGYIKGSDFEGVLNITGLTPGVQYSTYCYTLNLNRVPSTTFRKISYTNKPP